MLQFESTAETYATTNSGPAAGTLLSITSNTITTVTVSGDDLTKLGIVAGQDTFQFIPVDTLYTLLGTSTLLGGTKWTEADNVYIMSSGTFVGYYYNSSLGYWVRTNSSSTLNRNDVMIRPDTGIIIARRGPQMSLTFVGRVPDVKYRACISNTGSTTVHTGFPLSTTLSSFALNTVVPNWRSSTSWSSADQIYIFTAGSWTGFYHNGSNWRRVNSSSTLDRGGIEIPAGAPVQIFRPSGLASGISYLTKSIPYSL